MTTLQLQTELRRHPAPASSPHACACDNPLATGPSGQRGRAEDDHGQAQASSKRERGPATGHGQPRGPATRRDNPSRARAGNKADQASASARRSHSVDKGGRPRGERTTANAPATRGHSEHGRRRTQGTDERVCTSSATDCHATARADDRANDWSNRRE